MAWIKLKIRGSVIKEIRERADLTQATVAAALQVSQPEVALLESGKRKFLVADPEYLAMLTPRTQEWLIQEGLSELRVQIAVAEMARTTHRIFGKLPIEYVRNNREAIVQAIGDHLRAEIDEYSRALQSRNFCNNA